MTHDGGGPAPSRNRAAVPCQPTRVRRGRILRPMTKPRATRRYLPTSPFNTPPVTLPVEHFAVGDRVTHDRYGLGRVIGVEDGIAVLVDFASRQERIPGPFTKLTKL
ncbi:hypothetical protein SNS2_1242 [Streptomyces netropsis]|nr:hypothetical protein SNS2_1242 [Streptomyces netropsis]